MKSTLHHMLFFLWLSSKISVKGCTLPAEWDGDWHDSSDTTQDITFTRSNNYVVGWSLNIYSSTITSWTCVDEDTSNNLLLFKSNQTANIFGALHDVYRCIKWKKLSDFSYSYLIHADIELNAEGKRVLVLPTVTVTTAISGCNSSSGLPSAIETVVLIKKGNIETTTINCPTPFLGNFNYSLDDGSAIFCDGTSVWDVCTDRTQMAVNYTLCPTKQFYSGGGIGYCVYSTSIGSNYYVTVVNADSTVDFTTTFRFTCYAVNTSGEYVYASDNKGNCVKDQDPQTKSATGTGTLILSAYKTCPFTSNTAVETSSDKTGVIAGSVAGVVLVAAAVVAGVLLYKKYHGTRRIN